MKRVTQKDKQGRYYLTEDGIHSDWGVPEKFFGAYVDFLGYIEDILGDDYDLDRLRELVEADKAGRVLPKTSRVRKCPKCGKMNMYPRIDWKYFYCYSCETTFPAEEIVRPKAALAKEADHE